MVCKVLLEEEETDLKDEVTVDVDTGTVDLEDTVGLLLVP